MNREDLPQRWSKLLDSSVNKTKWKSLTVCDFQYDIKIKFEDGSKLDFKHVLVWENKNEYIVFTEHCGYHIFNKSSIKKLKVCNFKWVNKGACN